jgi:flavin reductase (DIM6/NTAB) family NADH-FMN oxidoreductase RutF
VFVRQAELVYLPSMADPYRSIKNAFSRYATGVTVVSCAPDGREPVGLTVNSFTSVSLEPTMVLWCIEHRASVFADFMAADHYAVSVLAADQQDYSIRFATAGRHAFPPELRDTHVSSAPLLKGRLAGFDCRVVARHEAGDHVILLGHVVAFDSREGQPLVYAGGAYLNGPTIADR